MLAFTSIPGSNIVEITVDGDVSRADFDAVISEINSKIDDYGSVDIIEVIRSIGSVPPSVFRDDLVWAFRYWKKIGRAAVVSDKDWIENLVKMIRPFVKAEVRPFDLDELEEARAWLRDGID